MGRLEKLQRAVLLYLLYTRVLLASYRHIRARGLIGTGREIYSKAERFIIGILLLLPSSRKKVASELAILRGSLASSLAPPRPHLRRDLALPHDGLGVDELEVELEKLARINQEGGQGEDAEDWRSGRVSGAVYGLRETDEIIVRAYEKFAITNPLHPDVFPGVRKMEAEIVSMVLGMYNNAENGAGSTTSGGTESILLACKAYRDWGRKVKGITQPEMIVAASAHAAFWKASDYFGIKLHMIPVDEKTRKIRLDLVKRAINPNTVMLVGSAPNFPDGTIDDIPGLAKLALKYKLGLHVDCCLGSFIVPFLEKAGFETEAFDFRVNGVTSISCDTHKYGFAPKGSSVLMWRDAHWRTFQFYVLPGWTGGLYASPTLAGSRPGALIAGCWAVLMHHGEAGYIKSCRKIMTSAQSILHALRTSPVLRDDLIVFGNPKASVVAWTSKSLPIMLIGDRMRLKGWHLSGLENPPGLHIAVTMLTDAEKLIADLEDVVADVKAQPKVEGEKEGTMVALYGLGSSKVGSVIVPQVAQLFLEALYIA